jgi:hypothetical protein
MEKKVGLKLATVFIFPLTQHVIYKSLLPNLNTFPIIIHLSQFISTNKYPKKYMVLQKKCHSTSLHTDLHYDKCKLSVHL